jgi:hypothetical protein
LGGMRMLFPVFMALAMGAFAQETEEAPARGHAGPGLLKTIVIPKLVFRESTLTEAVEYLVARASTLKPEAKRLNVILQVPPEVAKRRVTLTLKDVSFGDALEGVTAKAGCQCTVEQYAVVVSPVKEKRARSFWFDDDEAGQREKERLGKMPVAEVRFQESTVSEALEFLEQHAKKIDPAGEGLKWSVRFSDRKTGNQRFTLALRELPLDELLRYFCEVAAVRMRVHAKGVDVFGARPSLRTRLNEMGKDIKNWPRPSLKEVEHFLRREGATAENLDAAGAATAESVWFERGLREHPTSGLLLMPAYAQAKTVKEKRALVEAMQAAEPDNAVPWLFEAAVCVEEKKMEEALTALRACVQKPVFRTYYETRVEALKRLMVDAGEDPLDAEAYGLVGVYFGPWHEALKVVRGVGELRDDAQGDEAEELAQLQYEVARKCAKSDAGRLMISELTYLALERMALLGLPEDAKRDWLPKTPGERLKEIAHRREGTVEKVGSGDWLDVTREREIGREFIARFRKDGEWAAFEWLGTKKPAGEGGK